MKHKAGYCKSCKENRKLESKGINHILHLMLTVVTGGIWALIWILVALNGSKWACSICGSRKVRSPK